MATARPWYHFVQERVIAQSNDPDSPGIATTERDDDAALIVAAVNAYDTLRAENARLRGALGEATAEGIWLGDLAASLERGAPRDGLTRRLANLRRINLELRHGADCACESCASAR